MTPYYQDDLVTIYHGDAADVIPIVEASVVVTDPPFGIGWAGASWSDHPELYPEMMRRWLWNTKDYRAHFVWQSMTQAANWHQWFPDKHRILAVCKTFVQMRPTSPQYAWDPVIFWGDLPRRKSNNRDWFISQSSDMDAERVDHPSPRRLDVMRYVVNLGSDEGDIILDPFAGSGSTLVAAKSLNRKAIGIEIEEKYCEVAATRCSQEVLGLSA